MAKRARTYSGHRRAKKSKPNLILMIGGGLLLVGLLTLGLSQLLGTGHQQTASAAALQSGQNLEATNLETGRQLAAVAPVEAATDRESRYLGLPSDPATLALAEAGQVGKPTLVWFHADWCHICQRVKPDVVNLGQQYEGRVKIIRLNVDHAESREAVLRYGVRATPTFVLIDAKGQLRGNVPGWPGLQAFTGAFDQLLAGG